MLLAVLITAALTPAATAQARVYIVGYDSSAGNPRTETAQREDDQGFDADYVYTKAVKGFAADLSSDQVADLQNDPDVAFIVRDQPVEALGGVAVAGGETVPTGVRRLGAATTATVSPKSDVGVAVIDTGVDLNNPDIDAVDGKNCITPGSPAQDDHGHGTHVAGTIAARNTGSGVVGVAPGTKIYAVKVLDSAGSGSTSAVICGIDWVTANAAALNIKVANMSLGGYANSVGSCVTDPERAAICRATALGVNFVVAAGNDGRDVAGSDYEVPATLPEVLTVSAYGDSDGAPGGQGGATCASGNTDDNAATFSNFASRAQDVAHLVAGPGVCIRSVKNGGGTATMSGTSMASPHVAGAVALCLGGGGVAGPCSGLTPAQVIDRMRSTAQARAGTFGFQGDPTRAISGRNYGYAVNIAGASGTTGAASEVGQTSGKVTGAVYPVDSDVSVHFDFGGTAAYGQASEAQTVPGGSGPTGVGVTLSNLAPGTTYHYRVAVSDASGTSYGADKTFTTGTPQPLIPATPITAPISLPAIPALPVLGGDGTGTKVTDPKSGDSTTRPATEPSKPSKTCTTWKARLSSANRTLAKLKKQYKGKRATSASRKKLSTASSAVRTAKAKVKRYC